MDKLVISNVNTKMGNSSGISVCKEHQVTRLQRSLGNGSADSPLLLAGSGQGDSVALKHILYKTGTVKTAGSAAAPKIGDADVLPGGGYDLLTQIGSAVQSLRTGCNTGGFTAPEKQGLLGRIEMLPAPAEVLNGIFETIRSTASVRTQLALFDLTCLWMDKNGYRHVRDAWEGTLEAEIDKARR